MINKQKSPLNILSDISSNGGGWYEFHFKVKYPIQDHLYLNINSVEYSVYFQKFENGNKDPYLIMSSAGIFCKKTNENTLPNDIFLKIIEKL